MSADICRDTEMFLVGKIKLRLPSRQILPFAGGTLNTDAEEIEPPFVVIAIPDADSMYQGEGTWTCQGTAQIISHSRETKPQEHAVAVREVYAALKNQTPDYSSPSFSFHGIDITSQRSASDDESKAHATIIDFVVGVGG